MGTGVGSISVLKNMAIGGRIHSRSFSKSACGPGGAATQDFLLHRVHLTCANEGLFNQNVLVKS